MAAIEVDKVKPRVLLLNPPGDEVYIRDYYCSKVSKTDYLYHPIDLLYISGFLRDAFVVDVLDAIASDKSPGDCLQEISDGHYDVIIFLSGAVSWGDDRKFLMEIRQISSALIIGSGDIFIGNFHEIMVENPSIDGIILDFFDNSFCRFLQNDTVELTNFIYRDKTSGTILGSPSRTLRSFEVAVPQFDLFPHEKYRYPFAKHARFATVLTDYGCPFKCHFCIMNTIGFKQRPVSNVLQELEVIRRSGIQEIYFADQTFGANRKRLINLCEAMIEKQFNFDWLCFSRVDMIDRPTLALMKKAGCHTILFGVESANQHILDAYKKGITIEQITKTFALCRDFRIETVGTFIIGLPGETEDDCLRTIQFALDLDCDYASFNVPVPRFGTTFRAEAVAQGWTTDTFEPMCQAYTYPVMGTEELPREKIWRLRNKAIMDFYLRPSYIVKRLFRIRNFYQLKTHFRGIYFMVRGMFK